MLTNPLLQNDGHVEVVLDPDVSEVSRVERSLRVRYKIPERSIKLGFIQKFKSAVDPPEAAETLHIDKQAVAARGKSSSPSTTLDSVQSTVPPLDKNSLPKVKGERQEREEDAAVVAPSQVLSQYGVVTRHRKRTQLPVIEQNPVPPPPPPTTTFSSHSSLTSSLINSTLDGQVSSVQVSDEERYQVIVFYPSHLIILSSGSVVWRCSTKRLPLIVFLASTTPNVLLTRLNLMIFLIWMFYIELQCLIPPFRCHHLPLRSHLLTLRL